MDLLLSGLTNRLKVFRFVFPSDLNENKTNRNIGVLDSVSTVYLKISLSVD